MNPEPSQPELRRPAPHSNPSASLALAVFVGMLIGAALTIAFVYFDPFGVLGHEPHGGATDRRPYLSNDER